MSARRFAMGALWVGCALAGTLAWAAGDADEFDQSAPPLVVFAEPAPRPSGACVINAVRAAPECCPALAAARAGCPAGDPSYFAVTQSFKSFLEAILVADANLGSTRVGGSAASRPASRGSPGPAAPEVTVDASGEDGSSTLTFEPATRVSPAASPSPKASSLSGSKRP